MANGFGDSGESNCYKDLYKNAAGLKTRVPCVHPYRLYTCTDDFEVQPHFLPAPSHPRFRGWKIKGNENGEKECQRTYGFF